MRACWTTPTPRCARPSVQRDVLNADRVVAFVGPRLVVTGSAIHIVGPPVLGGTGRLEVLAEDVGRHNALDKILGEALLKGIPTAGRLLLTSGRISSEMLRKGAHMGTPFLISRTSPTTLSIEAAKRLGITLIGYVRRQSFNVYTHPERLLYRQPAPVARPASRLLP